MLADSFPHTDHSSADRIADQTAVAMLRLPLVLVLLCFLGGALCMPAPIFKHNDDTTTSIDEAQFLRQQMAHGWGLIVRDGWELSEMVRIG